MKIFLSYTRKNWALCSDALGNPQNGFLERIENDLNQRPPTQARIWRDNLLKPGRKWSDELAAEINSADVFLILFSKTWICSDVCWREYLHLKTYRPETPVAAIWFEPVSKNEEVVFEAEDGSERFDRYRSEFPKLYEVLSSQQATSLGADMDPKGTAFNKRLDAAFGTIDGRQARMNAFTKEYSAMLWTQFADAKKALRGPTPMPKHAPRQVARRTVQLAGRTLTFLKIPPGQIAIEGRPSIVISHPFWIMQRAVPVAELFGQNTAPLTFGDINAALRSLPGGPSKLRLPNEDEWDHAHSTLRAMVSAPNQDVLHGGIDATQPDLVTAPTFAKEALLGISRPRISFLEMTESDRQSAAVKWFDGTHAQIRKQNINRPLGTAYLRLVV